MAISVSKQGWQQHSGAWNAVSGTYIGREDYSHYDMTEFRITPDKTYSSITLTFAGSGVTGLAAKWSTSKPASASASGTAITTASSNQITVTGTFTAGQTISIFVWSSISTYQTTTVGNASATGVEPTPAAAAASVGTGSGWASCTISIGTGSGWTNYTPSFGTGSGWTS